MKSKLDYTADRSKIKELIELSVAYNKYEEQIPEAVICIINKLEELGLMNCEGKKIRIDKDACEDDIERAGISVDSKGNAEVYIYIFEPSDYGTWCAADFAIPYNVLAGTEEDLKEYVTERNQEIIRTIQEQERQAKALKAAEQKHRAEKLRLQKEAEITNTKTMVEDIQKLQIDGKTPDEIARIISQYGTITYKKGK